MARSRSASGSSPAAAAISAAVSSGRSSVGQRARQPRREHALARVARETPRARAGSARSGAPRPACARGCAARGPRPRATRAKPRDVRGARARPTSRTPRSAAKRDEAREVAAVGLERAARESPRSTARVLEEAVDRRVERGAHAARSASGAAPRRHEQRARAALRDRLRVGEPLLVRASSRRRCRRPGRARWWPSRRRSRARAPRACASGRRAGRADRSPYTSMIV